MAILRDEMSYHRQPRIVRKLQPKTALCRRSILRLLSSTQRSVIKVDTSRKAKVKISVRRPSVKNDIDGLHRTCSLRPILSAQDHLLRSGTRDERGFGGEKVVRTT